MDIKVNYISTSCGRTPAALDCGSDDLIAFSAVNALGLIKIDNGNTKIIQTLVGHIDHIKCVRWIRCSNGLCSNKIITGSDDKTAIIWQQCNSHFTKFSQLIGHFDCVNSVDAIQGNILQAATTSVDSSIKIWTINDNGDNDCTQTINLNSQICLVLRLFVLPIKGINILAFSLNDFNIHIYGETLNNQYKQQYLKLQVLSGHEDWVRDLDFIKISDNKLMLASCSQDTYIRLWSIDYLENDENENNDLQIEKKTLNLPECLWTVSLEAVLSGHENWVYSINWKNTTGDCLKILSASFDKSLIVWAPDENGVWVENIRVGEVGGGGLGFYGGKFSVDGNRIIGHSYTGSFHIWKHISENGEWQPDVPCGGHFGEVIDLDWEPEGNFFITASYDKTTRVHAPWIKNDSTEETWHELARPQIHGYDMSSLAIISKFDYASGSEEKVIRTFKAPNNFVENFSNICKVNIDNINELNIPEGASVPSLGLSNKAIYTNNTEQIDINEKSVNKQYTENRFISTKFEAPPTEETLMQNTLWPEQQKLYGHGYEIFSLAASKDGTLLASACKATQLKYAAIILWSTKTWLQIQSLTSHNLTITQMMFSPDNMCLLSVSRDRRWSLFRRENINSEFFLEAATDKKNGVHTRIIWSCAWTHDSKYFTTGSRDGKVVVWGKKEHDCESWKNFFAFTPILNIPEESVTALAFGPTKKNEEYILAAGFESGFIHIYSVEMIGKENQWKLNITLNKNMAHHLTIQKIMFRPISQRIVNKIQFATVSNDNATKLFTLCL